MITNLFNNSSYNKHQSRVHSMEAEMKSAIQLLQSIEEQKWDAIHKLNNYQNSDLLKTVRNLGQSMESLINNEQEQLWKANTLAEFSALFTDNQDSLELLSQAVLSKTVKLMNGGQGTIYIVRESSDGSVLELKASYASAKKVSEIELGEGILGQCFLDQKRMLITKIPKNYIKITSGMGAADPRCILLEPINNKGRTLGVIEISTFKTFSPIQLEFIHEMTENFGANIVSVKESDQTKRLLKQSEILTAELHEKEELQKKRQAELDVANREIEERKIEIKEILERESELVESKIRTHRELTDVIINKLKSRISELEKQLMATKPMTISYMAN